MDRKTLKQTQNLLFCENCCILNKEAVMATSSIYTDFAIDKLEDAQNFAAALEKAERQPLNHISSTNIKEITDPKEIQSFFGAASK
ncbi:MAG: hypothetical protein IK015_04290 [Treponema sp.]|nr:hypothetical protein [Treponema sp.]